MSRFRTLIFTTCYNERLNIGKLIDEISKNVPGIDILVVDDNSPDGTWNVITERQSVYANLYAVKRPGKLGIGSAHKYALFYAMREGYETLITMDADFSHDPRDIPKLLNAHEKNTFVTGSRYCTGGSSDYSGYRDFVSRIGNALARKVLGVKLHELTTYFRVFDVDTLRGLPLRHIAASGYSYGVELVYYLRKAGVELREVPIHFADRAHGASKIPKWQIIKSAFDLFLLGLRRLNILRDLQRDVFVDDHCGNCGDRVLAMKSFGNAAFAQATAESNSDVLAYRCTAVGSREYPPVYKCLNCGLEQVPGSLFPRSLERIYEEIQDDAYIKNIPARRKTYQRCLSDLSPFLPSAPGRLLEVGSYCGIFLQEAAARGWAVTGVEPSMWATEYAREVSQVPVVQGFLSNVSINLNGPYDLVVSWDVLEHVRDPIEFLRECAQQLSPEGALCISTLDVDTWMPKLLGTRWPWLMNMHLFYFGKESVRNVFERAGLDLLSSSSYVHYARVKYAFKGLVKLLPAYLQGLLNSMIMIIPDSFIVPVSFGDVKMYVLKKKSPGVSWKASTIS